jgi:hypothetical protein
MGLHENELQWSVLFSEPKRLLALLVRSRRKE